MYVFQFIPPLISLGALVWAILLRIRTGDSRLYALIIPAAVILAVHTLCVVHGISSPAGLAAEMFYANIAVSLVWASVVHFMGDSLANLSAAEQRLAAGDIRTQTLMNSVVDGVILIDTKGNIQSANPGAERLFGYTASELIGHNVKLLMPEPYRAEHDGYLNRYLETGRARIIGVGREVEGRRKDGSTFPCYLSVSEFYLGENRYFTGIVHDLSDLHQERNFISAILNVAGALVVVLDREGRIVRFNRACARTTGYTLQDVRDKHIWDILIPPEEVENIQGIMRNISGGDFPSNHENEWMTREGGRRLIEWANTALADEYGNVEYIIATGIDITEKRKGENEIRRLSRGMLEIQEEERNRIAREIHDTLGQSLIALKFQIRDINYRHGDNEALKQDCDSVTEYINGIARESRELSHSLSPISMRNLGLSRALEEMARTFEAGHGVHVAVDLEDVADFFQGDWNTDVYRMAQEALINACKHGEPRNIEMAAKRDNGRLVLRVADDGIGLDGERDLTAGLGLRIMKERADHLGASVDIQSRPGEGTEVVFEFRR